MVTVKILIFATLSLTLCDSIDPVKEKRSVETIIAPDGEHYNDRNVLYNEESPYGDGFYGFELFRQLFEKSGTVLGSLTKVFETFSYKNISSDLMLLRRFLNIIIRIVSLLSSFLPVPEISNSTMEDFSKLYPGTSITTVAKDGEEQGLPDVSDIPEKPESIYDYVTKKTNDQQEKGLTEEEIIRELSKIDLQRINSLAKRNQGSSNQQTNKGLNNNNKKVEQDVNIENKIYFPSSSLPNLLEKTSGSSPATLEEFIRDRNKIKKPTESLENSKLHPKIDLRSHHIYEADLSVLNSKKNS